MLSLIHLEEMVFRSYVDWRDRAGRFRSLGDGQVDFSSIFTKLTTVLPDGLSLNECAIKDSVQGVKEGVLYSKSYYHSISRCI